MRSHSDDDVSGGEDTPAGAADERRAPLLAPGPLERFLDSQGLGKGPVSARRIGDGHSNVTFAIQRGELRLVLRRPPRPPFHPSAHDVLREAATLSALAPLDVRTPEVIATCADPKVIGAPFFLMEHVDGVVISTAVPAGVGDDGWRWTVGMELVDSLAEIHAIDLGRPEIAALGREPARYLERQLDRFGSLWESRRTRDVDLVERAGDWLADNRPRSPEIALVHGDFRLGNVMFEVFTPHVIAVLDWEMATLGDPLGDLGYMLAMWAAPEDSEPNPMLALSTATREPGFPSRAALGDRYRNRTGRSTEGLRWYEVLALWKSAIFLENSYGRYLAGTTDDPYFATLDVGVPQLARAAWARINAD